MSNTDTTSNSPDVQEQKWWCVECKVFTNPSTHEHVIQRGEFSDESQASNSSEELERILTKELLKAHHWVNSSSSGVSYRLNLNNKDVTKSVVEAIQDLEALINREIAKQKKQWWKKGWEDGRAEVEQARQQLLDELEKYVESSKLFGVDLFAIEGFIQAKRSNHTKKGE